jgi:hypothetical protein
MDKIEEAVRTGMKVVYFVRFESTGSLRVGFSSKHSNTIFSFHLFRSWGPWMMLFFTTRFAGEHGEARRQACHGEA